MSKSAKPAVALPPWVFTSQAQHRQAKMLVVSLPCPALCEYATPSKCKTCARPPPLRHGCCAVPCHTWSIIRRTWPQPWYLPVVSFLSQWSTFSAPTGCLRLTQEHRTALGLGAAAGEGSADGPHDYHLASDQHPGYPSCLAISSPHCSQGFCRHMPMEQSQHSEPAWPNTRRLLT